MPSLVTVTSTWTVKATGEQREVCSLDARYGTPRFGYSRETAEEMARVDDLIEAAGIVPGDRIVILHNAWVEVPERNVREERLTWYRLCDLCHDAVFVAVDNGRFRVRGAPGSGVESESWSVLDLESIIDVRKE